MNCKSLVLTLMAAGILLSGAQASAKFWQAEAPNITYPRVIDGSHEQIMNWVGHLPVFGTANVAARARIVRSYKIRLVGYAPSTNQVDNFIRPGERFYRSESEDMIYTFGGHGLTPGMVFEVKDAPVENVLSLAGSLVVMYVGATEEQTGRYLYMTISNSIQNATEWRGVVSLRRLLEILSYKGLKFEVIQVVI